LCHRHGRCQTAPPEQRWLRPAVSDHEPGGAAVTRRGRNTRDRPVPRQAGCPHSSVASPWRTRSECLGSAIASRTGLQARAGWQRRRQPDRGLSERGQVGPRKPGDPGWRSRRRSAWVIPTALMTDRSAGVGPLVLSLGSARGRKPPPLATPRATPTARNDGRVIISGGWYHTRLSAMPNRWQGHAIPRLGGRSRPGNAPDFCTTKALGIQPSRFGA
jgi:hypothetical protein